MVGMIKKLTTRQHRRLSDTLLSLDCGMMAIVGVRFAFRYYLIGYQKA